MSDPIETRNPEVIRAHKAKGGKVEPQVGRCGEWLPTLVGPNEPTTYNCCSLPAGHAGWHHDRDNGAEWGPPAPDLPPGVTRCTAADGTEYLTALGRDVPDGWVGGLDAATIRQHHPNGPHIVRPPEPPAEPRTERVPWYLAPGRHLPHGELIGAIVQAYPSPDGPGGMYVEYDLPERQTTGNPHRYPNGDLEVLALGDTDGKAPQ